MSVNRHNRDYDASSPPVPLATGDVYRPQDFFRDLEHIQKKASQAILDLLRTGSNVLVSGLRVTQGAGDTISVTTGVAYVQDTVTVPDSYATNPPTTRTETVQRRVEVPALTDQAIPSATLDGATTNFVKIAYAEIDVGSRQRLRGSGTYVYEKADSYTLVVNSTAATASELTIATLVGSTGGTFTIGQTIEAVSTEGVQVLQQANASQLLPLVPVSSQLVTVSALSNETAQLERLAPITDVLLATTIWSERQTLDGNVQSLTFGNDLYIAGTNADSVWTSPDGVTWTNRQTLDADVFSLTFGNNLYVAGTGFGGTSVWTSTNGITWTERQTLDNSVNSLTFGNNLFVAGTAAFSIWTSTDGITWTERQDLDGIVSALTFGNNLFVAGTVNGNSVWTSSDGITWTERQTLDGAVFGLTFGNDLFVAGTTSPGDSIWTSPDGITWTERQMLDADVIDVVFGDNLFVAGTAVGGDSIWTSVDGATWIERQRLGDNVNALTFGNQGFVAGTGGITPGANTIWTPGI